MASPPLVQVSHSDPIDTIEPFRLVTPSTPVAIKRVDAVGHIDARIQKSRPGRQYSASRSAIVVAVCIEPLLDRLAEYLSTFFKRS